LKQDLTGQVAWITGAGTGIGESAAIKLSEAGCKIVLSGRREEKLEDVAAQLSSDYLIKTLDVSVRNDVISTVDSIINEWGQINIGVFSAGLNIPNRSWEKVSLDDWDKVINVDLNGAFYCNHAVLSPMKNQGGGLIINISSMAAKVVSSVTGPAYTAAKTAMSAMTADLLFEQRNNGIRATSICPGEVATPILDDRPVPPTPEQRALILQAEDLGDLVLFIASMPPHATINDVWITPTHMRKPPTLLTGR
jgi:NADP-dependent 3-hydroxy acid dehydrogenase YdfG